VGATERLVLFPTWLLLDLLGVVMLSTFGYEQLRFGNDAFTSTDFKGTVFLPLGDPTDIFYYQGPP